MIGEPVPNVAVVAYDQRFRYAYTFTDAEGFYAFESLPVGTACVFCPWNSSRGMKHGRTER